MTTFLTATFQHELPSSRYTDFEWIFMQCVFSEERLKSFIDSFNVGSENISHVSSIKVYKHKKVNLSTKTIPILTLPITLDKELKFLNTIFNN